MIRQLVSCTFGPSLDPNRLQLSHGNWGTCCPTARISSSHRRTYRRWVACRRRMLRAGHPSRFLPFACPLVSECHAGIAPSPTTELLKNYLILACARLAVKRNLTGLRFRNVSRVSLIGSTPAVVGQIVKSHTVPNLGHAPQESKSNFDGVLHFRNMYMRAWYPNHVAKIARV